MKRQHRLHRRCRPPQFMLRVGPFILKDAIGSTKNQYVKLSQNTVGLSTEAL
jgi:hypothetical protein